MANITPMMVKELRGKTGAGMGDCKKALVDSDGNMDAAIEVLRKKGAASAAKRADRAANEGTIASKTSADGKIAAMVEVNSETDFVAINQGFVDFAAKLAGIILENNPNSVDDLMKLTYGNDTVEDLHNDILAKFSEKIEIRRFDRMVSEGYIASYIHAGSKLAVLVEVSKPGLPDSARKLVRDIAMQVAAMNPQFIQRSDIDENTIAKEKEIYKQVAIDEGKKPDIAERIASGKLEKFFTEQCLLEQAFVKDGNKSIKDVVKEVSDDAGDEVKILSFKRFYLGES